MQTFLNLPGAGIGVWLIDFVIVFTLLEGAALWLFKRLTGRGVNMPDLALTLAAGLGLMLALRSAALQSWSLAALCLLGAGLAHGLDLRQRWRG